MGLYNYDETIFDDMILPDGVGRENFITELLLQLAELEVVYARPDVMKTAIKAWSASRLHEWNRIYTALTFDYNALYNKEGKITETINTTGTNNATVTNSGNNSETVTNSGNNSETVTNSGNNSETITNQASGSTSGSNIHSVSAYNETGFQNAEKDEQSAESSSSGSQSVQGTTGGTQTTQGTTGSTQTTQGSNGSVQSRTLEEAGNIGVTMSQDMLKAEISVRSEFDITHIIIDEFKRRFCILVY
jgi:hypothetical protein